MENARHHRSIEDRCSTAVHYRENVLKCIAPFYVDQDNGWTNTWASFDKMYLPQSRRVLAEYHSGLKPNEYYIALAERDRLRAEYREKAQERTTLDQTFRRFQETLGDLTLNYDIEEFEDEVQQLVAESDKLHADQISYKRKVSDLHQTKLLWEDQVSIINAGLVEMRESYDFALGQPSDVECPTCGAHYENSIAERFALIEDWDGLMVALSIAREKIDDTERLIDAETARLQRIQDRIMRIDRILSTRKADLTFRDVVTAEGRNEAARIFRDRLAQVDDELGSKQRLVDDQAARMDRAANRQRTKKINTFFAEWLARFNNYLDVRTSDSGQLSVHSRVQARGSELPRALLAYYYAFLHTSAAFSSSAFCPVVIDAPNQQGQDEEHMPAIMRFLVTAAPEGAQVVVAAENLFGLDGDGIDIVEVGEAKNQVLRSEEFEAVRDTLRPLLTALI